MMFVAASASILIQSGVRPDDDDVAEIRAKVTGRARA
jgi:hypothetical protein